MASKKDKKMKYTEVEHDGEKLLVYNYAGNKGDPRVIAFGGCQDFDSGVPCVNGQPDPYACPAGYDPKCVGGSTYCICEPS